MSYLETEGEELQLLELRNQFWVRLGQLVAEYLAKVPMDLQDEQLRMMQDMASLYGSDFQTYLKSYKEVPRKNWAPPNACEAVVFRHKFWRCKKCQCTWSMTRPIPTKCPERAK